MKLSFEEKMKIYNDWKLNHKSPERIAKERNLANSIVKYIVKLADRHGIEALEHKWTFYSPEFKEAAIKRAMVGRESINEVSLDLRLSNHGTLKRWIKEYKENGYTVIERKKGRHAKEETEDGSGIRRRTGSLTPGEPETYDRERILKEIRCLGFGKREIRKEEIAAAVTELRQETECSLEFILKVINEKPDLPHITRSTYYYTVRKEDKDYKNDDLMNEIIHIFYAHKERYGYRRITLELNRRGFIVNHKTVQRLMNRMLDQAVERYPDLKGAIFHTDQGWQYQHYAFRNFLESHNMIQSMSRKGNCLDDALMENFFGLMKTEMFYGQETSYASIEELIQAMHEYIHYFNHDRIKVRLKGLTPMEYRNQAFQIN